MADLNLGSNLNITGKLNLTHNLTPDETVFEIHGSSGQLFSITDSLEGDLFSVNDISGLPILTVNSDDLVIINGITQSDSFVKSGGLSSEFLMADGSVTTISDIADDRFVNVDGDTMTGDLNIVGPSNSNPYGITMKGGVGSTWEISTARNDGESGDTIISPLKIKNGGVSLLTVLTNGNLGLNTPEPSEKLHIRDVAPIIRLESSNTTLGAGSELGGLEIYHNDGSQTVGVVSRIVGVADAGNTDFGNLLFQTRNRPDDAFKDTLKLHGNGNAEFSDNVTANSFIKSGATSDDILLGDGTTKTIASIADDRFVNVDGDTMTAPLTVDNDIYIGKFGTTSSFLDISGGNGLYVRSRGVGAKVWLEADNTYTRLDSDGFFTPTKVEASSLVKTGGISTEFLKADGSVDDTDYNFYQYGLGVESHSTYADLNNITTNEFFKGHTSTLNTPFTSPSFISGINLKYSTDNGWQILGDRSSNSDLHFRKQKNGIWSGWEKIWTTESVSEATVEAWDDTTNRVLGRTVTDLNSVVKNTWFIGSNTTLLNGPTEMSQTFQSGLSVLSRSDTNISGWQLVSSRLSTDKLAFRKVSNGTWGDWSYVWDSNNLNNVSDLIDDGTYVKTTGDTMTGDLILLGSGLGIGGNIQSGFSLDIHGKSVTRGDIYLSNNIRKFDTSDFKIINTTSGYGIDLEIQEGFGLHIAPTTGKATFDDSVIATSYIKSGGLSTEFLKADGSVDNNTYITGITVTDDNVNPDTHQIATVEGTILKETVTKLNTPTLSGNILTLSFQNENDVVQTVNVDLSSIVTNESGINNATYNAASNVITLTETDGDTWTIDLSEFSIVPNTDEFGVTTLTQEGVVKLTVSKVGQTGEWADILSKPTTLAGYGLETEADNRFVNVSGDTMTGILRLNEGLEFSNYTNIQEDASYNIVYTSKTDRKHIFKTGIGGGITLDPLSGVSNVPVISVSGGDGKIIGFNEIFPGSGAGGVLLKSNRYNGTTGFIFESERNTSTTDTFLELKQSGSSIFFIDNSGNVTANSFIKSGATSDDILLGDGNTTSLSTIQTDYTNKADQAEADAIAWVKSMGLGTGTNGYYDLDLNDITETSFQFIRSSTTNNPTETGFGYVLTHIGNSLSGSQMCFDWNTTKMYIRKKKNGNWESTWKQISDTDYVNNLISEVQSQIGETAASTPVYRFDETSYMLLPSTITLGDEDFTTMVKFSCNPSTNGGHHYFFNGASFRFYIHVGGQIYFFNDTTAIATPERYDDNKTHTAILVRRGEELEIWVDGELVKTENYFTDHTINYQISKFGIESISTFEGKLYNGQIYNVALSEEQIKQIGNNPDNVPFELSQVDGSELVGNNTFDTDEGWNLPTGATIVGGTLNLANVAYASQISYRIGDVTEVGEYYKFQIEIPTYTTGMVRFGIGNNIGTTFNTTGIHTVVVPITYQDEYFVIQPMDGNGTTLTIDNVSVVKVGNIAKYGESKSHDFWYDNSGNNLHLTNYGAELYNNTEYIIENGQKLEDRYVNKSGDTINGVLNIDNGDSGRPLIVDVGTNSTPSPWQSNGIVVKSSGTHGTPMRIGFETDNGGSSTGGSYIESATTSRDSYLSFVTRNASVSEKMRITPFGDIGIGTSTPSEKLDVVGGIKSQSHYIDRTKENLGVDDPFLKLGLHHFHGGTNSLVLQKSNRTSYIEFGTQNGGLTIQDSAETLSRIAMGIESGSGVLDSHATLHLKLRQHSAANNNDGRYLTVTNSSNATGVRGVVNVNGDFTVNDYSTSSKVEKIKLGNDGSGLFLSDLTANSFIKLGGLSTEFLKADGSVDDNAYPPLDPGTNKIPEEYLPDSVLGQVEYQGTWNASTDTPTLPDPSTVKGHYYVVGTGGTYSTVEYNVGDWIISNGTTWEKVDNSESVVDVFGRKGQIVAQVEDYAAFYVNKTGDTMTGDLFIGTPTSYAPDKTLTISGYNDMRLVFDGHDGWGKTTISSSFNGDINLWNDGRQGNLANVNIGKSEYEGKLRVWSNDEDAIRFGRNSGAPIAHFGLMAEPNGYTGGMRIKTAYGVNTFNNFDFTKDGHFNLSGDVNAGRFIKSGATSNDILLGDGSTTSLSTIQGDYVKKSGDTMTGYLTLDVGGKSKGNFIFTNTSETEDVTIASNGLTINRTNSYIKPLNKDTQTLYLGNFGENTTNWAKIHARTNDFEVDSRIVADSFVKAGGTSSQYLKADGTIEEESSSKNPLQAFNPFNGFRTFDGINTNAFHGRKKSLKVLHNDSEIDGKFLFDGAYESSYSFSVTDKTPHKFVIDFMANGFGTVTYSSGHAILTFYSGRTPESIQFRHRDKYGAWSDYKDGFPTGGDYGTSPHTWACHVSALYVEEMEFLIVPGDGAISNGLLSITEIEWHRTRMTQKEGGNFTKTGGYIGDDIEVDGKISKVGGLSTEFLNADGSTTQLIYNNLEVTTPPSHFDKGTYVMDVNAEEPYNWPHDASIVWGIKPAHSNYRHLQFHSDMRGEGLKMRMKNGSSDSWLDWTTIWTDTSLTNITQIANRSYNDLQDKPVLNSNNWDTAYNRGDFRDYGLGVNSAQGVAISGGNLNSITLANGLYKITPSTLNSPIGGEAGVVIVERAGLDNYITQRAQMVNTGDVVKSFIRHYKPGSSTWTPWRRLWTTEDFTSTNVGNWNTAFTWGNHGSVGYLTDETDPVFSASPAGTITEGLKTNWNTAFGWGDHAAVGYLTSLPDHNHDTRNDGRYVNLTGDTMTGNLGINVTADSLFHVKTSTDNVHVRIKDSTQGGFNGIQVAGTNASLNIVNGYGDAETVLTTLNNGDFRIYRPNMGGYLFTMTPAGNIGINTNSPTNKLDVSGSIGGSSFIKTGGLSTEFLKADGSVDTNTYLTGITVTDDNTSPTKNQIATVEGVTLYETVGEILQPELTGNILNIKYRDGDGVIQSQPVDLSSLVTNESGINNATYDAASNVITLTETDGDTWTIDLSEFSIITSTDGAGVTTVTQEGLTKLTISKVGQTGEWNDILNKPTTFTPSPHNHDADYVNVNGDTMTGDLVLNSPTYGSLHINRSANTNVVVKYSGANGGPYYAGFDVTTGNFGFQSTVDQIANSKILLSTNTGDITANKFIKSGGTSTEFLMADGSVKSDTYSLDSDVLHTTGDETKNGSLTISKTDSPDDVVFEVHGSAGQLFSVTDSLEGDLFSVNDISGLPILTVNSEDRVIIDGDLSIRSGQANGLTTDSTLTTVDATENDAAYFDYMVKREDGPGMRSGTLMVVWDGTNVSYSDTSTNDLGGTTIDIEMVADILGGEVRLRTVITAGTWTVKVGTRTL